MKVEEMEARLKTMENQMKTLENQVRILQDIEAIKKLQKAYGYYVEHMMRQEIVDCFSDSPEVALYWIEGTYLGKEGVRRYFERRDESPPEFLHQVMQIAGIVDIESDGKRAKGRWYAFGGIFVPRDAGMRRSFVSGIYEMEYIKEEGIWKILTIRWVIPYALRIPDGWALPEDVSAPLLKGEFKGPQPDIPIDKSDQRYLSGYIFPFHYKHPVSGKETSEVKRNASLKGRNQ